ncbi:MAG TPA: periplasmic heavy metal sensor [Brevundimonas sp.]
MTLLDSPRTLKVALAISVALNLFAVAGGVTVWVAKTKTEDKIQASQAPGREASFHEIVRDMDPAVQDRVRISFRASAMAAKPDFEQSRNARRQAIELSKAESFDPVVISTLLDQSRAAEIRGRTRLERDTIALLATLDPKDRQSLSVIFNRRGKGGGDGGRGRSDQARSGPNEPRPNP